MSIGFRNKTKSKRDFPIIWLRDVQLFMFAALPSGEIRLDVIYKNGNTDCRLVESLENVLVEND